MANTVMKNVSYIYNAFLWALAIGYMCYGMWSLQMAFNTGYIFYGSFVLLAVVSCVSVNYDHDGYITQYRTTKDTPVMDSELCLDLGELVEDLNGLCDPVYEHTQPVYEP